MTAIGIAAEVRAGTKKAREVIEEHLARIEQRDGELNAFNLVTADEARKAADEIDRRVANGEDPGPLAGVPLALKDNMCTRGVPTTCSSRILEGWKPPYTATAVERLVAAGGVMIGKTNLDEFAMGSSTENSAFGPTANPHDASRVAGGSSGGSAAAVAADFAPLGFGSDTGGSIRLPASFCGVVGVKPTYGRVSRYGLVAFASSLDQIGPFGATVADAGLALDIISGHDPMDSTSIPQPATNVSATLNDGVDGLRIGIVAELRDGISPDVLARLDAAAVVFEKAGATIDVVSMPSFIYGLTAYYLIAPAEASSNLARYDGVRYGLRVDGADAAAMNAATRTAGFGAEVKRRIMLGTYALSAGYYDAYYGKAQKVRTLIARDFASAYERFDLLLSPTSPTTAFEIGAKTADPLTMYLSDVCTIPSNLAGNTAMSVPFGVGRRRAARRHPGDGAGARRGDDVPGRRRPRSGGPSVSATDWEMVVGLEVHVELATRTKLFCGCPNHFGDEPNTNICPVCLGLPGSLPVINRQAVELAITLGQALHCRAEPSIFHRKNYFYPDMPKDYQVSQYDRPINVDGYLDLPSGTRIGIERAHMEEDTGKSTHLGTSGRIHGADASLVDYNRAGVPLVEIVSRPDIRSARRCARRTSPSCARSSSRPSASDAKMEEGSMRVDANVSIRPAGTETLGTRCEIKNLNSIRSLGRAIEYEAKRQIDLLEAGERVRQETRHWNEDEGRTHTLRSKEEADDYRYFPEPDLVPLEPDDAWISRVAVGRSRGFPPTAASTSRRPRASRQRPVRWPSRVERDLDGTRGRSDRGRWRPGPRAHPHRAQPRRRRRGGARARRARRSSRAWRSTGRSPRRRPRPCSRRWSRRASPTPQRSRRRWASRRWRRARSTRSSTRSSPRIPTSGSATARATRRPAASSPASSSARSCGRRRARPTASS